MSKPPETRTSRHYPLVGGPQDGARVRPVGGRIPATIFVGPRWLGDGYAALGISRFDDKTKAAFYEVTNVLRTKGASHPHEPSDARR